MENIVNKNNFFKKSNLNLTPEYITGISDAEGSFQISIHDMKGLGKTGYKVSLEYKITQRDHSLNVLLEIRRFFNCGRISIDNSKTWTMKYVVTRNIDFIERIIPHFDKYPLKTSKYLNYLDLRKAVYIIRNKEHFSIEGINLLKKIKLTMNKGRSFKDKFSFYQNKNLCLEAGWVQGFIDGEASFQCEILINNSRRFPIVNLILQIQQSKHDIVILNGIKDFFHSGYLKPKCDIWNIEMLLKSTRKIGAYWNRKHVSICKFLDEYPLYTNKRLDYLDWERLINLKNNNMYKDKNGLLLMKKIKSGMNINRIN